MPGQNSSGKCIIDEGNLFNGNLSIFVPLSEDKSVTNGKHNLFASDIRIAAATEHLVYDINTKEKFNIEQGVEIGDKNWIGTEVLFLNKAACSNNSVIGARSVVTKKIDEPNVLIAGNPAKIRKRNISWHRCLDESYLHTDNPLLQI